MTANAVRAMSIDDAALASAISAEAGRRFAAIAEPRIAACADDPPFAIEALHTYIHAGRAWVATAGHAIVGFVIVDLVDGRAHIEEVDVAPSAGRHGHGARLVGAVVAWARSAGLDGVTLTTFRDVPWNAPWYARLGFRTLQDGELTPELRRLRDREDADGLPVELRVVMHLGLETA